MQWCLIAFLAIGSSVDNYNYIYIHMYTCLLAIFVDTLLDDTFQKNTPWKLNIDTQKYGLEDVSPFKNG